MATREHEVIFLQQQDEADPFEGRQWCEDDGNWESPGVKFIRYDIHDARLLAARADERAKAMEECAELADNKADTWDHIQAATPEEGIENAARARVLEGFAESIRDHAKKETAHDNL